ncbi:MAG: Rieske (2Fe-2S) protein [Nanoarchaeota archaeon]
MSLTKAGTVSEVKPGQGKPILVNGKSIALFNVDGKFFALDNTCPHAGGPLGEGMLEQNTVVCPWHGWEFDVTSGNCLVPGGFQLKSYKVEVKGEEIWVEV